MENSTILHSISPETLQAMIRETFRTEFQTLATKKEETTYLTRLEVCDRLRISLPTLGEYVKHGAIIGHKIGRRVLFEEAEIRKALQEIPNRKYSRTVRR